MGTRFDALGDGLIRFIEAQHIFFVATAAPTGRVNVSPKGMDSLRVLGPRRIVWRNVTGSGNETAGHLLEADRMTLMWCGFEAQPMVLRAYGTARTLHPRDADFAELNALFPPFAGARQVFDMSLDLVQRSCGYAVPFYDHAGGRDLLAKWTEERAGRLGDYWAEKNAETLDGAPTGIVER